jgi:hypothetical protein
MTGRLEKVFGRVFARYGMATLKATEYFIILLFPWFHRKMYSKDMRATLHNGITVEGEPDELAELIRRLVGGSPAVAGAGEFRAVDAFARQVDRSPIRLRKFVDSLKDEQKALIRILVGQPNRLVPLRELRAIPNKRKGTDSRTGIEVAGLLAAITRHWRREMSDATNFVDKTAQGDYQLADGTRSVAAQISEILESVRVQNLTSAETSGKG